MQSPCLRAQPRAAAAMHTLLLPGTRETGSDLITIRENDCHINKPPAETADEASHLSANFIWWG